MKRRRKMMNKHKVKKRKRAQRMKANGPAPSPFFSNCADPRVTYVHVRGAANDLTIGEKRNRALAELATSPVVANFDDDDLYGPSYLPTMVRALADAGGAGLAKLDKFAYDAETRVAGAFDAADPPAAVPASLVETERKSRGFGFVYARSGVAKLESAGVPLAFVKDDACRMLHVQHGRNVACTLCTEFVDEAFLRRSPVGPLLRHLPPPARPEPFGPMRGVFVFDDAAAAEADVGAWRRRVATTTRTGTACRRRGVRGAATSARGRDARGPRGPRVAARRRRVATLVALLVGAAARRERGRAAALERVDDGRDGEPRREPGAGVDEPGREGGHGADGVVALDEEVRAAKSTAGTASAVAAMAAATRSAAARALAARGDEQQKARQVRRRRRQENARRSCRPRPLIASGGHRRVLAELEGQGRGEHGDARQEPVGVVVVGLGQRRQPAQRRAAAGQKHRAERSGADGGLEGRREAAAPGATAAGAAAGAAAAPSPPPTASPAAASSSSAAEAPGASGPGGPR
ncbi:hypothetical protein JL721_5476 [Aureococcus anophagefferens]|nr:hypothetical protein JL721_5476 [Aureococcus anophagefferens]